MTELPQGLLECILAHLLLAKGVELRDKHLSVDVHEALSDFTFWTTAEAQERCMDIVSKVGGPTEKRRANALFSEVADNQYWQGSRYPDAFIPSLRVQILPADRQAPATNLPTFFSDLYDICTFMLDNPSVQRGLTPHTLRSLLAGASRGWTTLTANKSSIRSVLKAMRAMPGIGQRSLSLNEEGHNNLAAVWIVDPRSLAEGMRYDFDQMYAQKGN
jgi:hypothetical protein